MSAPPLRRALCLAYGAGSIGAGIFSTIPGLLLLFYLTDTLAVPAGLAGLANYPTTQGTPALRQAIAAWMGRRYGLEGINPETEILPVNGSREALFALASGEEDLATAAHAQACPSCRSALQRLRVGASLLREAREAPPPDVAWGTLDPVMLAAAQKAAGRRVSLSPKYATRPIPTKKIEAMV